MMKTIILVCVALAACTCALAADASEKASPQQERAFFKDVPVGARGGLRIYNGNVAAPGQFPYYVAVYVDMAAFCGGSLIHHKWVLTAAHCVDGKSIWTMFMGVLNMNVPKEEGREVHVSRGGLLHPKYDKALISHDVGLVQLLHPVNTVAGSIDTVKLTAGGVSYVGKTATVAGFGLISDESKAISDVLKYTSMPIVDNDECYDRYGSADNTQLCLDTATVGTSSCSGDSGGPLVIYDAQSVPTQIGATSFGAKAGCTLGLPVGFSNLAVFIDWIAESTGLQYPFNEQP